MDTTLAPPAPPRPGKPRFQRLRVIFAMVVREMGTRFGRSAGGYLWALGEPLGGIMMLAIAFSLALRSPPIGTSASISSAARRASCSGRPRTASILADLCRSSGSTR